MTDGTAISENDSKRFMAHWQDLAGDDLMPHTTAFLSSPDPTLISFVHIIELTEEGQLVRFMGTGLVGLWGEDRTNQILGAELPSELKDEFNKRVRVLIAHQCGLVEVAEFSSPTGRPFEMETVILPLAVDEERPPRICSFSKVIDPLDRKDSEEARFKEIHHQTWIDIGKGVPEIRPQDLVPNF